MTEEEIAAEKAEDAKWDKWDLAANRHLLAHLLAGAPGRYLSPQDRADKGQGKWSPDIETVDQHKALIAAKAEWAKTMREEEAYGKGGVPLEIQTNVWDGLMRGAEERCAAIRAKHAATRGEPAAPAYPLPPKAPTRGAGGAPRSAGEHAARWSANAGRAA